MRPNWTPLSPITFTNHTGDKQIGLHLRGHPILLIGGLRRYYGNAEDNVHQEMNLYFTYESRDTLKSLILFITVKAIAKLNLGHRGKFEIKFQKTSRRGSPPSDNAEFGHFTSLFCRGRQRNVQRFINTCTAIVLLIKPFV